MALALVLPVAVAACGGDGGSTETVEGTGYSYALPEDWDDRTDASEDVPELELGGIRADTLVTGERRDDFFANVNVIREPGLPKGFSAGDYAELVFANLRDPASSGFPPEVVEAIEDQNVRDLRELGSIQLAGEPGAAWQYAGTTAGRELRYRQLVAVRSNAAYTLTYTASRENFEEDLPAFEEIVESWQWE